MARRIRRGQVVLLLLVCGCMGAVSPLERYQAKRHYEYGLAQLYLQDTQAAYDEFECALELNPYEARTYEGLGLVMLKRHDYESALTKFDKALELDPGLASSYQHVSDIYVVLEEWDKAIKYAKKALTLPSFNRHHLAYYNQGKALFGLKRYDAAKQKLTKAIKLAPKWAEARLWLGMSLAAQGEPSLAIVEYRNALVQAQLNWYEQDKQLLGYLHYQLGMAYIDKGYVKQGVSELKQSLDIYPSLEVETTLQKYALQ